LAWLGIGPSEQLFLEIAEDYAVVSRSALEAVQVKDTAGSGGITIRSRGVCNAIDAFVDLVHRNKTRPVTFRFLTTSPITIEQSTVDRIEGGSSLIYWRRAAAGADVAPLRAVMLRLNLSAAATEFIATRTDSALRDDLLRRMHWDCGAADLGTIRQELDGALLEIGDRSSSGYTVQEVRQIAAVVLESVLDAVVGTEERVLTQVALRRVLEQVTHISVARRDLEALVRGSRDGASAFMRPELLRRETDTNLPSLIAPRAEVVLRLNHKLTNDGIIFLCGATGMGKTLLARLTARSNGGNWMLVDFSGLDFNQTNARIEALLGAVAVAEFRGLILDDLNEIETAGIAGQVARLKVALARKDQLCMITSYRTPSIRARSEICVSGDSVENVTDLSVAEVSSLVHLAGGDAVKWGDLIYIAAACGHPQLTQAVIADVKRRGWPSDELNRLGQLDLSGIDVAAERTAARRRLVAAAPEGARVLLYRISVLISSFKRDLALALGAAEPKVSSPGEHLDSLVGPWVDLVSRDRMRISPLLSDAAATALSQDERQSLHRIAAAHVFCGQDLDVEDADSGFAHALIGEAEEPLTRFGRAVVGSDISGLSRLSGWLMFLRTARTDQPIYPGNPELSRLLRLGQVLLEVSAERRSQLATKWHALNSEIYQDKDDASRAQFEGVALAKILLHPQFAEVPEWIDCLLRLDFLLQNDERVLNNLRSASTTADGDRIDAIGFLFLNLTLGLPTISSLVRLFQRLDSVDANVRRRLLARLHQDSGAVAAMLNSAWLKEHEEKTIDGRSGATAYGEMARLAMSWNERDIAIRCQAIRSVMLDEYANDDKEALAALDEAEVACGPDPVISRARAKIAYRRRRHSEALDLLRDIALNQPSQDPVERAFLCREAAISATEVGEQEEALIWFRAAREAALQGSSSSLQPMIVGLKADEALAEWRCGRAELAIQGLAAAVGEVEKIDPKGSLKAIYLHKVIGHACLWLNGQVTGEAYRIEGDHALAPPGICSNPEPIEEIRTLPPSPIDGAFYLLSMAEIWTGKKLGVERSLNARLKNDHIFVLEIQRRRVRFERAVRAFNLDRVSKCLLDALDAIIVGTEDMKSGGALSKGLNRVGAPFPKASIAQRTSADAEALVNDAFFALRLLMDLHEVPHREVEFAKLIEQLKRRGFIQPTFLDLGSETRQAILWKIWQRAREKDAVVVDYFGAGLRMLEWANSSLFGRLAISNLGQWAQREWPKLLGEQRFRLRSPAITIPEIEAAIASDQFNEERLAAILRATRLAVGAQLSPELMALLVPRNSLTRHSGSERTRVP
jgi:hypothetical protein